MNADRQGKQHKIAFLEIRQLVEGEPGEPGDGVGIRVETGGA